MLGAVYSLLLIELAPWDRFHRAVEFPRIFAWARAHDVAARWLRFGVSASAGFGADRSGAGTIELEESDFETLLRNLRSLAPRLIVWSWPLAEGQVDRLRRAAPNARLAVMAEGPPVDPVSGRVLDDLDLTARQLLFDSRDGPVRALDFGFEAANQSARSMQPLPHLDFGGECTHRAPFAANPFFAGADLSETIRPGGCAFCDMPPARDARGRGLTDIKAQLVALHRTHPPVPGRMAVRLFGEGALRQIEAIADIVSGEIEFERLDLLLDARVDRLLAAEERLGRAASRLEGTGHRVHVALVGVESFSDAELARFNKGVTVLQNLDAILCLLRLEAAHPETFAFREHGGLSLILLTPWTTLDDLLLNLRVIEACAIEDLCGKVFTSRVRLTPGLALTAAAERDGLLLDEQEDPAFDTAARNQYVPELPWRFRDPRVTAPCRLFVRLDTDTTFPAEDGLAAVLRKVVDEVGERGRDAHDLARAILRCALSTGKPTDPFELLAEARGRLMADAEPADEPGFDESFAEAMATIRERQLARCGTGGAPTGGGVGGDGWKGADLSAFVEACHRIAADGGLPGGVMVSEPTDLGEGRLRLRLTSPEQEVELDVTPAAAGGERLFELGPFHFSYPRERPLDRPEQVRLVRVFVRQLKLML